MLYMDFDLKAIFRFLYMCMNITTYIANSSELCSKCSIQTLGQAPEYHTDKSTYHWDLHVQHAYIDFNFYFFPQSRFSYFFSEMLVCFNEPYTDVDVLIMNITKLIKFDLRVLVWTHLSARMILLFAMITNGSILREF